jgi:DNA repair exonuclease SbcCD ATPase subunit
MQRTIEDRLADMQQNQEQLYSANNRTEQTLSHELKRVENKLDRAGQTIKDNVLIEVDRLMSEFDKRVSTRIEQTMNTRTELETQFRKHMQSEFDRVESSSRASVAALNQRLEQLDRLLTRNETACSTISSAVSEIQTEMTMMTSSQQNISAVSLDGAAASSATFSDMKQWNEQLDHLASRMQQVSEIAQEARSAVFQQKEKHEQDIRQLQHTVDSGIADSCKDILELSNVQKMYEEVLEKLQSTIEQAPSLALSSSSSSSAAASATSASAQIAQLARDNEVLRQRVNEQQAVLEHIVGSLSAASDEVEYGDEYDDFDEQEERGSNHHDD